MTPLLLLSRLAFASSVVLDLDETLESGIARAGDGGSVTIPAGWTGNDGENVLVPGYITMGIYGDAAGSTVPPLLVQPGVHLTITDLVFDTMYTSTFPEAADALGNRGDGSAQLWINASTVKVTRCTFGGSSGSAVFALDSAVTFEEGALAGHDVTPAVVAISDVGSSSISFLGGYVQDNLAGGVLAYRNSGAGSLTVAVSDATFLANDQGALVTHDADLTVTDTLFEANQSDTETDVAINASDSRLDLQRVRFCNNVATSSGAVLGFDGSETTLLGAIFQNNTAEIGGMVQGSGGVIADVRNVTSAENFGGHIQGTYDDLTIRNVIFTAGGDAVNVYATVFDEGYDLFDAPGGPVYNNDIQYNGAGNLYGAASFSDSYVPTDCTTWPFLKPVSDAVDAGEGTDTDGSPADIGAMSSIVGDWGAVPTDADTDTDTDTDTDADSDTDTDTDADTDGSPDTGCTAPGFDIAGNVIDEDCDGRDAFSSVGGGCSCGAGAGDVGLGALLGAVAFAGRRRATARRSARPAG